MNVTNPMMTALVVRESENGQVRAVIPGCQIRAVVVTATYPENIPNLGLP